jgi:glutaredoxin 3
VVKIEIYTKMMCPFCWRAKHLLDSKGVVYEEIHAYLDKKVRDKMRERSFGANTFPQIFIGGQHIGGCDELHALEADGKLDGLLV